MNLELSEDQEFFRETTRRFLESEAPLTVVRELWDVPEGFDRQWWAKAAELGWTSMFVPETHGGGSVAGRPTVDAVIVAEEMGRLVAPGPFLPVNVVAAAVGAQGSEAQQAALFPGLLAGESIATWAFAEPGGAWNTAAVAATAEVDGGEVVLRGKKAYVEAAGVADTFLVTARAGGRGGAQARADVRGAGAEPTRNDALTQVLVPATSDGLTVTRGRSIDLTRRYGSLAFDGVRLPLDAVVGEIGGADAQVEQQLLLALALQNAETVGAADRVFEFTTEYAQDRYAFGRPIASFQALKHRMADMLVWLEFSKAIADASARAIDDDDPEATRLVSVAAAYVGDRCLDLIDDCVQISGGIGVTWEHDIHLYSRRVAVNRAVYGSPEQHKEHVAVLLGA